jgi:plastocyanin
LKRSFKIAIISGILAVVIIAAALTVHFRLSETEKSEIQSGAEQKEKESASQIANEIVNSLQNKPKSEQNENAETNENTEQTEKTAPNTPASHMEISIIEVDNTYRWSTSTGINPPITLTANVANVLQFTNPTDTKHAFIIGGSNGTVVLQSKDIVPGLSAGKLSITPNRTGVFEYHCKYHPDTMKGIVTVEP